jgi:branched-chain amino acid transport system substrate-binding protein
MIEQHRFRFWAAVVALILSVFAGTSVRAAEPIRIGFGMALTGGLAAAGKTALLAMQIWQRQGGSPGPAGQARLLR